MGVPDSSLLDLIKKLKSWVSWKRSDSSIVSGRLQMEAKGSKISCDCDMKLNKSGITYLCKGCNRIFCGNCVQDSGSLDIVASGKLGSKEDLVLDIISCKFCNDQSADQKSGRKFFEKIYPSESPRESPEPPSPNFAGDRFDGYSPLSLSRGYSTAFSSNPSPVSTRRSPSRSDDDEAEDSTSLFFSPSSEYFMDSSDLESSCLSARHDFYSFKSAGSSPSDSPSRMHISSGRAGQPVQQSTQETPRSQDFGLFDPEAMADSKRPDNKSGDGEHGDDCAGDLSIYKDQSEKPEIPLDFENNGLLWFPPPPDDENDESENNFFSYDDEDDEIGEPGKKFSSSDSLGSMFSLKEKQNVDYKATLHAVIEGHFKALVSQLLQAEGLKSGKEDTEDDWLQIVTTIAWQAANFVKPDIRRGGSMDPGDYVKVKCVASGTPRQSMLIKGVVCTKNIKHKRMTSQYQNPRLLILEGALEYQKVPNELASFNTLLEQEHDQLKMIVSKIEAQRANVLLVEKSVSPYAQELLLAKEISLVLNVKKPLLERIARCTGAAVTPSVGSISITRLGHCELFHLEKFSEEHEPVNQFNRKPSRTLMFFDGCPRRLGCTVLLRGSSREELKKVKHAVQYAVFAAYHLSLETSFLADEGASLPRMTVSPSMAVSQQIAADNIISSNPDSVTSIYMEVDDGSDIGHGHLSLKESKHPHLSLDCGASAFEEIRNGNVLSDKSSENLVHNLVHESVSPRDIEARSHNLQISDVDQERQIGEDADPTMFGRDVGEASGECYRAIDCPQSILVSFSSRCVQTGDVCERSRLLRIKFYGCFDKPLGKYLQENIFDQTANCQSCKEPVDAHVICYTHRHGNLTINVRRIPSVKLPGERDRKIWMWHRCLRCPQVQGVPPASHRVVMSNAAWGLSFGKFLELSFTNRASASRVASCGHSLQKDCLRYYGCGSTIAFFRYSPIDILSVCLPPPTLEFGSHGQHGWIRKEAAEIQDKVEALYAELSGLIRSIEHKKLSFRHEISDDEELQNHIVELKDQLIKEKNDYHELLQLANIETPEEIEPPVDILELNRLRYSLLITSRVWDHRLCRLDALLDKSPSPGAPNDAVSSISLEDGGSNATASFKDGYPEQVNDGILDFPADLQRFTSMPSQSENQNLPCDPAEITDLLPLLVKPDERKMHKDGDSTSLERAPSAASILSDKIDSAWTGTDQPPMDIAQLHHVIQPDVSTVASFRQTSLMDNPAIRRLRSPARVYSFDSAVRLQERIEKGLPPSPSHLTALRSFHASGDYRNMVRDPVSYLQRTFSQMSTGEAQMLNIPVSSSPFLISAASLLPDGARLMVPQNGHKEIVLTVYDTDPTSIVSFALSSKEYSDWVIGKPSVPEGVWKMPNISKESPSASSFSALQSFSSLDLDYLHYGSFSSEDTSTTIGSLFADSKSSPHVRISFEDDSTNAGGKAKFSVLCYFAKQFHALRRKCCPNELDFIRSLSRCKRWRAQGGKSNVYFAKSFDERFMIKGITKTELESFEDFAPQYFKYLTDSLTSGSPTCLAKVLGLYQVTIKHARGGKETKLDFMVMENLFFGRNISRVYDLKGSERSRYNSDTTGADKVLLDMNLVETLRTKPIFLGSKPKRRLERAVWNDTSFLASVDVMDYSLLVGVDETRKELVLGIIDFMRQYTWDKHLETWVKASGILGGPKNASPTIVSPKQYKKRFRKAMTSYFLTVPDQWSS